MTAAAQKNVPKVDLNDKKDLLAGLRRTLKEMPNNQQIIDMIKDTENLIAQTEADGLNATLKPLYGLKPVKTAEDIANLKEILQNAYNTVFEVKPKRTNRPYVDSKGKPLFNENGEPKTRAKGDAFYKDGSKVTETPESWVKLDGDGTANDTSETPSEE